MTVFFKMDSTGDISFTCWKDGYVGFLYFILFLAAAQPVFLQKNQRLLDKTVKACFQSREHPHGTGTPGYHSPGGSGFDAFFASGSIAEREKEEGICSIFRFAEKHWLRRPTCRRPICRRQIGTDFSNPFFYISAKK
ncbi:MAG: hypothetical protein E7424_04095 [Ruminococcaceae bacterium]|nr:hypothetical protein [Oscillospiraceae bacterium]